VILCVVAEVFF